MNTSEVETKTVSSRRRSTPECLVTILLLTAMACATTSEAAEPDFQLWFPTQVIHPFSEKLSVSMQTEVRLQNDISDFSQLVYKPAFNLHFSDRWALSVGYKYIDKYQESNENDIWQEGHFNTKFGDLVSGFQLRLEERMIDEIGGVIPRIRLLQHLSHPIADSKNYLTGFGAVRFNLDNKGTGPVSGFEQSRVYAALGRHIGPQTLFEVGYLWRYEEQRDGFDSNDHAIHFQLVFNTQTKPTTKPQHRDRYR